MKETLYFVNWHRRGMGVVDDARLEEHRAFTRKDLRERIAKKNGLKPGDVIVYDCWVLERPGEKRGKPRA